MARANAIYYASHDPFSDFTTAPEISQVFGEIIGLWAAVAWQSLGSPNPVCLVEAGPGRGTLMADALRAIRQATPSFAAASTVHLIETSARLRAAQALRIPNAVWHADLSTIPDQPMILLANEFLDALPVRQFVRRGDQWMERFVTDGQWLERPGSADALPPDDRVAEGDVVEVNEAARAFVADLSVRFRHRPGVALLIDYGPLHEVAGNTLQALAARRPVNPLSPPGSADLTAHVNFTDLARITREHGAVAQGPRHQGDFLRELGLFQRTARLARGRADAGRLLEAARRLVEPAAMGELFKVLAICSPGCPFLAGLAAEPV